MSFPLVGSPQRLAEARILLLQNVLKIVGKMIPDEPE